ncbi:MAG: accessory factor UbiK family protein [Gammaproteobacteria bacterium]|nr:accessory factor UbiK family protein [Gammaproteobacteria bacterium]
MKSHIEQLTENIGNLLPGTMADDLRRNIDAMVRSALDKMNLVTREELEIQEQVLQRTREKVEQLQTQVAELESRLKD